MRVCRRCNQKEVTTGHLCPECTEAVLHQSRQRHVDQDWSEASGAYIREALAIVPILLLAVGINVLIHPDANLSHSIFSALALSTALLSIGSVIWDFRKGKEVRSEHFEGMTSKVLKERHGTDWGLSPRSAVLGIVCLASVAMLVAEVQKERQSAPPPQMRVIEGQ